MSDARAFTDYHASCILNNMLQKKYNIQNSHEYRAFLQHNANKVMKDMAECEQQQDAKACPVCRKVLDL